MGDWTWDEGFQKASARRDVENQATDEYGLHKPATSWTERLTDWMLPREAIQAKDASSHWYSEIPRAMGAGFAGIAGHVMDNLSPVNTRGDWHVPVPILGELAHGTEVDEYRRERAAAEAAAGGTAPAEATPAEATPAIGPVDDGEGGVCGPHDGMYGSD